MRYYSKHRDEILQRKRTAYWANRDKALTRLREYNYRNPSWMRLRKKKLRAVALFGGKCERCGFTDWRALQFDHKYNDGSRDRKLVRQNAHGYYDYIMKNPEKFSLLCSNCNWIKRFEVQEAGRNPRRGLGPAKQGSC